MKTKLKTTNFNPRSISRALFHKPFYPQVNFALEDPLLLSSHPLVEQEGLSYTKYFGANSPLSIKASEFLEKKYLLEEKFSELMQVEKSLILKYQENLVSNIEASFLSSQKFFVPDSILSPFKKEQTIYFSSSDLFSLVPLLKDSLDHLGVVFLPKISLFSGKINYFILESIKKQYPFFLIIEDNYTFGLEGIDGFSNRAENSLPDLLITTIPKTFGKMLTIFSGKANILERLMEYSFKDCSLFPPSTYLGMFDAFLTIIPILTTQRDAIKAFVHKLKHKFQTDLVVFSPLFCFPLNSYEEKIHFAKSLVDKGFLLPSSSFTKDTFDLCFHINYLLEEKSIQAVYQTKHALSVKPICQSI
jgi:7-keto-8-aminopelargonate synthetase-like enzyme